MPVCNKVENRRLSLTDACFFLSLIDDVCFRVRDGIKVSIYGPVFTLNRPDMPFRSDWEYIVHI